LVAGNVSFQFGVEQSNGVINVKLLEITPSQDEYFVLLFFVISYSFYRLARTKFKSKSFEKN